MKNKLLFIAATHDNEGFSIEVLKKLEQKYSKEEYNYDWIIGNPEALKKNTRFIDVDLNRVAPGNQASNVYEEKRAADVIEICNKYDFVIDIHGSNSNCGICTIISYPNPSNISLAKLVGLEHNVIWYSEESSVKGPINQHVNSSSLELECGPKNDPKIAVELYSVLENIIINTNRTDPFRTTNNQEFYEVYDKEKEVDVKADFVLVRNKDEEYFPFLSNNSYKNISHYKMKKIDINTI